MANQYGVTSNGFARKPINVILNDLNSKFKAAFGANFDTNPLLPDGQIIGIVADAVSQCWEQAQEVYNAYRPGATEGVGLDNICELTGVKRYINRHSRASVYCTGDAGTVIPAGSIVSSSVATFKTQNRITIPSDVSVVAVEEGAIFIEAGSINKIVTTGIGGWKGVTNSEAGETGVPYETDPLLRARRDRTTAASSSTTVEAIYAALSDLNLTYIRIRDNDTDVAINGQPAGSVFVVVDGGSLSDIAERIYRAKTGGVPTHGTTTSTVMDSKGYPHTIKFSRSTRVPIFITGTFKRRTGANVSSKDAASLMTDAMMNYLNGLQPGESVVWSSLFRPLMESVPFIEVDSLVVGIAANALSTKSVDLDIDKRAQGVRANIKFTDITV